MGAMWNKLVVAVGDGDDDGGGGRCGGGDGCGEDGSECESMH